MGRKKIEDIQKEFYLKKFQKFGDDPRSVSYNDKKSQYLRFQKINELYKYEKKGGYSIHEVGCGLGHYKEFLDQTGLQIIYSGSDIVQEFIDFDRKKFPDCKFFIENISGDLISINPAVRGYDYYCLSGTFNPKENTSTPAWESFIFTSMKNMFEMAKKGFCVNFLTKYSEFYDKKLYYADPKKVLDWCITSCSRFVTISHDTPLYEFTVYVYKDEYMERLYSAPAFSKYFKG